MDRSRAAEWILSTVLPPDRAAAVIGDFTEEAASRGAFWFWSSVLRTVAARIANDFFRRPLSLFGVGIGGCVLTIAPVLVLALIAAPFARYGHRSIPDVIAGVVILPWRVQCGVFLARWKPNSALASCIAVILVGWVCIGIVHTTPPRTAIGLAMCGLQDVLLIAGMFWERYRGLRNGGQKPVAQA